MFDRVGGYIGELLTTIPLARCGQVLDAYGVTQVRLKFPDTREEAENYDVLLFVHFRFAVFFQCHYIYITYDIKCWDHVKLRPFQDTDGTKSFALTDNFDAHSRPNPATGAQGVNCFAPRPLDLCAQARHGQLVQRNDKKMHSITLERHLKPGNVVRK